VGVILETLSQIFDVNRTSSLANPQPPPVARNHCPATSDAVPDPRAQRPPIRTALLDDFSENVAGQKKPPRVSPKGVFLVAPSTGIDPYPLCHNHASRSQGIAANRSLRRATSSRRRSIPTGPWSLLHPAASRLEYRGGRCPTAPVRSNRLGEANPLRSECIRHRCLSSWLTGNALPSRKFRPIASRSQATRSS